MLQGFVATVIGTAQVLGDMHQGIVGGNAGVYGEQWGMAGIAAAERALCGVGEGWIGDDSFHGNSFSRIELQPPVSTQKAAVVRGVENR
ncbi:hypothetical protein METHP15_270059 [Pseudomonas sp. P15-2025]